MRTRFASIAGMLVLAWLLAACGAANTRTNNAITTDPALPGTGAEAAEPGLQEIVATSASEAGIPQTATAEVSPDAPAAQTQAAGAELTDAVPVESTAVVEPTAAAETPAVTESGPTQGSGTPVAGTPAAGTAAPDESTVGGEEISVEAEDGLQLKGDFYLPAEAGEGPHPVVLLLHMSYRQRQDWQPLIAPLTEAGYAVLALDLRGHGQTGGELDWERSVDDVQRTLDHLRQRPEVDPERIYFIGASMGANLSLVTAAANSDVRGVVLLSPGINYFGVGIDDDIQQYGERPLLIIASQEDEYAAESSQQLSEMAGDTAELKLYDGAGHGTDMFRPQSDLVQIILDWLDSTNSK